MAATPKVRIKPERRQAVHELPEQVARRIAASEVIVRPASAVKELMENSLDAGARSILVEIVRGGSGLVAVADDGCGMAREDAILSLRGHATSKIRSAADLTAIRTLGFRGQALASIASLANMRMQTRLEPDPEGIEIAVEAGNVAVHSRACAMAAGTRVEVRFLETWRKFLKKPATEQGAIDDTFKRAALANHHVGFTLIAEGRTVFELPRAISVLERFRQIFGPALAAKMAAFDLDAAGIHARGLLTVGGKSFPTPQRIFTFINGRPIRDRLVTHAIEQACASFIPPGRYPAAVLFVDLPCEDVDVNVHPMKAEVVFRSPGAVFEAVYSAIRDKADDLARSKDDPSTPVANPHLDSSAFARRYGADAESKVIRILNGEGEDKLPPRRKSANNVIPFRVRPETN
ncbi:MAG: DNA mismatch repair endonuclease MutL [Candidatus Binataceae bacterium]|jgi:DNA mismatch repair protein MutL